MILVTNAEKEELKKNLFIRAHKMKKDKPMGKKEDMKQDKKMMEKMMEKEGKKDKNKMKPKKK